ncbi:MAG TPA: hypothetical protein VN695_19560 [Streptosporangiaceae bacterium]|nr:hypothetical protein [Streptosporangiaceae bacterium]
MSPRRMFRSKAGWTSAAAVLVVAGVLTGTMLANAAGPSLPKRTPAQLLVAMRGARPPGPMTAVITENANLGFPSLPNIPGLQSSVLSGASFITGTHTFDIWYGGPRKLRIAIPVSFGETDLRVNGNQVWLWDSHGQNATHYILPNRPAPTQVKLPHPGLLLPRCLVALRQRSQRRARIVKCIKSMKIGRQVPANFRPLTPQQAADKFLAAIGPTTKVTVAGSTVVAGRPAYELVIAPRTSKSLISQIVIAVDSKTYLPLRLDVFSKGTSSPAFQVGYTSLTFGKPAASNFTFTPPAGAHVKTEPLPAVSPGLMGPLSMGEIPAPLPGPFTSQRWLGGAPIAPRFGAAKLSWRVRIVKGTVVFKLPKGYAKQVGWVKVAPKPARAMLKPAGKAGPPKRVAAVSVAPDGNAAYAPVAGQIIMPASRLGYATAVAPSRVKVLGSGWLSVAVLPAGASLPGLSPSPAKHTLTAGQTPSSLPILPAGAAPAGQVSALARILLNSAAPVRGTWGSGRLLRTNLFSVLITNSGKILIGAVTPDVLYADAAKVK